jgi:hypothetical protein
MLDLIARIKGLMQKYGISYKPLWNTETGWLIQSQQTEVKPGTGVWTKVLSETEASAYVARAYTLAWSAGVARFYWYDWDSSTMGLSESGGALKVAGRAYQEVEDWLVGAQMDPCQQDPNSTWICHISRQPHYNAWIVWNPQQDLDLEIPSSWDASSVRELTGGKRDLRGITPIRIGPTPILLEALGT